MATVTVSANLDKRTEQLADSYIRRAGLTADQIIRELWSSIASTGLVPQFATTAGDTQFDERRAAFRKAQNIVSQIPRGTKLATMSDEDIRKELENRNV